jgi:hypothetical protein
VHTALIRQPTPGPCQYRSAPPAPADPEAVVSPDRTAPRQKPGRCARTSARMSTAPRRKSPDAR